MEVSASTRIEPTRDERLALYLVVVVVGTAFAMIGGGLAAMLLVTPFAVALPLGMRRRADAVIDVRLTLDTQRCLEGDTVRGQIDITGPPGTTIEVAIECPTTALTAPPDDPWAWHIGAELATPIGLPLSIETNRWGRFSLGQLLVRVIDHGSLFDRRAPVMDLPDLMVLPMARQLDELLPPAAAHAALGAHPARRRTGDGYDFAEIRAYQPGDRMRDLNWRATLRRGEPHVNRRHPERSGDVVIVLDAFPDSLRGQTEIGEDVILRAGRAAWAIAREHLHANDRVGFVAEGSNPVWLPPGAGRRARYALLQALLDAFSTSTVAQREIRPLRRFQIPPAALVIAISPLGRERTMRMMIGLRGAGRAVAVMAIDTIDWLTADWLAEHGTALPEGARRIAQLTFEERIATLRRQGVPVVEWRPSDDLGRAVRLLGARPAQDAERGMTPVAVPEQTGELARRWLTATIAAAVVAATIPVVAGGPDAWACVVLGILTVVGFTFSARHRWTFNLPVASALLSVVTVPDSAPVDRAIVALPTAIAVLATIECAVVTRRLDTTAPVSSTAHDPAVIVATLATAAIAGGIVAGLAQLDRFGWRAPAAGATVALGVLAVTVRGRLGADESD